MGVMVAVLDTTFWLATHVVCITLGYAATFLAGFLGLTYVAVKVLEPLTGTLTIRSRKRDKKAAQEGRSFLTAVKDVGHSVLTAGISGTRLGPPRKLTDVLGASVYGTICFAIFFSLVGTVLGGLWADDSWGRFWGWDPKENGAMLIVIWNAVILHARWDKMVRDYGVAVLAMIGNIVTAWSWFGVNELSAGLHNYGFTEGRLLALATFVGVQAAIVLAASANGWWKKQSSMA